MDLKQLRKNAHERLKVREGIDSPELDADLIIMNILGIDRTALLSRNMNVSDAAVVEVNAAVNRRISGMPVRYITGKTEFMSLEFYVNRDVLIPRSETETLAEAVIGRYRNLNSPVKILDIGCGSGCIGLSLGFYIPHSTVTCLDISEKALRVAKRNAKAHRLESRTKFICGDITDKNIIDETAEEEYDCIVSNPPYIPTDDISDLQTEIVDFEPLVALDGGEDGLDFYRVLTEKIIPKKGGTLALEVGMNQSDAVAGMMYRRGYSEIEIIPDLSGKDRVVLGVLG